ncbi:MAG: hypothetical protein Kow0029_16880 [Candidatus Rifleibacteriota bacterium]
MKKNNKDKKRDNMKICNGSSECFEKGNTPEDNTADNSLGNSEKEIESAKQKDNVPNKFSLFSRLSALMRNLWEGLILRQFFQKIFSLLFALVVFGFMYFYMKAHKNMLTYMGVMLLMVIVYAEILVIRDHLWVIEGSMRESRKWRDIFFNETSLRRQRLRKILVMVFAMGIFSYVYMKSAASAPILSFMGVILMITVLYFEILTIRDDVYVIMHSIKQEEEGKPLKKREKEFEKFIDDKKELREEAPISDQEK